MVMIPVSLTENENKALSIIALQRDAAPGELLAAFVADLVKSGRSGGSDERMLASDWLYRQTYRWIDGELC